jgi:hypothetical protein
VKIGKHKNHKSEFVEKKLIKKQTESTLPHFVGSLRFKIVKAELFRDSENFIKMDPFIEIIYMQPVKN